MSIAINSIGLILDIIGVVILFKYGLPSEVSKDGQVFIAASPHNEEERRKYRKFQLWSKFGLGLLVVGFGLQIISNYL